MAVAIIVVVYLIAASFCAKWYFRRRHGVSAAKGEPGTLAAGFIGLLWPVSVFLPAVRHPRTCGHHRHVLEHERLMNEVRAVEQLKEQRGY